MKLAVVGSRNFNNYDLLVRCIEYVKTPFDDCFEIISGGADGADKLAKKYAENWRLQYTEFPADWDKLGKSAGFVRNQQIVDACDVVMAFWDGKSKGTQDTINKAKKAKKPTFIVYF